jgi:hypothetical protein
MRRRQVLALGGMLGVSAVAGCLDALDGSAPDGDSQNGDGQQDTSVTPTPRESSRDTPTPGESSRDSQVPDEQSSDRTAPDESTADDPPPDEPASNTPAREGSSSAETGFDPTEHIDDWQDERVRGESEPIAVTATIDSAVAVDLKCARVAKDAVGSVLDERLPQPIGYYGVGRDPEGEHEYVIRVGRTLTVKQNGTVTLSPDIPFDLLRSLTPRAVGVTADHEGAEQTCNHPVYVQDRVLFSG